VASPTSAAWATSARRALAPCSEETPAAASSRLDLIGSPVAAFGLFCIVFGFSHAQSSSWVSSLTIGSLCLGAALLVVFAFIERRVAAPLLPLRIVLNRNRGGSYAAMGLSAVCMFGVFLFLTYYLQLVKGYSPLTTGVAFLPMIGCVLFGATVSNVRLLPIIGPRLLAGAGMLVAAAGMFCLSRTGPQSGYAGHVLSSLLMIGLGFGLTFAPAINMATAGVAPTDAGIASAMVNTMQQVGGSVGTALLSTIAATATASYAVARPGRLAEAAAAVHGYTVAFIVAGCILAVGAVIAFSLLQGRPPAGLQAGSPARPEAGCIMSIPPRGTPSVRSGRICAVACWSACSCQPASRRSTCCHRGCGRSLCGLQ
jgi:hypothetical protein